MENGGGDAFGVDGGDSTDTAAAGVGHNEIDWSGGEAAAVGRERLGGQQRQQVQNSSFVIQNSSFSLQNSGADAGQGLHADGVLHADGCALPLPGGGGPRGDRYGPRNRRG